MKKLLESLQALFGEERNHPTVRMFKVGLERLGKEEQGRLLEALCRLAFGYYRKLPMAYRRFVMSYLKTDRDLLVRYLVEETPWGKFRYDLFRPDLFLNMASFVEMTNRKGRLPFLDLATSLLMAFPVWKKGRLGKRITGEPDHTNGSVKAETLAKQLRLSEHSPETILELAAKRDLTDEYC